MLRDMKWVFAVGTTLCALGCSDPVPAAAGVGLTINLQPATRGGSCPTFQEVDDIGNPPPDSSNASVGPGKRIYDGSNGVNASCTMTSDGKLSASIRSSSPRVTFDISDGLVGADGLGTANISLYSPVIGQNVSSTDICKLTVIQTTTGLQVRSGAIWARYDCGSLQSPPQTNCQGYGEFILENCAH